MYQGQILCMEPLNYLCTKFAGLSLNYKEDPGIEEIPEMLDIY